MCISPLRSLTTLKESFTFFNLLFSLLSKDVSPLLSILDNAFWCLCPCVVSSYVERGLAL